MIKKIFCLIILTVYTIQIIGGNLFADNINDKNSYNKIIERPRITIVPIEGGEYGTVEVEAINKLTSIILETGAFTVVERTRLNEIIGQHKINLSGLIEDKENISLGNGMLATQYILFVNELTIMNSRGDYEPRICIRIMNLETGKIIFATYASGITTSDCINTIKEKLLNYFKEHIIDLSSQGKKRICVLPSQSENYYCSNPFLSQVFCSFLYDNCELYERDGLSELFKEIKLDYSGLMNEKTVVKIGNLKHINYALLGFTSREVMHRRLVNTQTREIVWGQTVFYKTSSSPMLSGEFIEPIETIGKDICQYIETTNLEKDRILKSGRPRLIVLPIPSQSKNSMCMSQVIAGELANCPNYTILEYEGLKYLTEEMNVSQTNWFENTEKACRVGKFFKADFVLLGNESRESINLRIIDVNNGAINMSKEFSSLAQIKEEIGGCDVTQFLPTKPVVGKKDDKSINWYLLLIGGILVFIGSSTSSSHEGLTDEEYRRGKAGCIAIGSVLMGYSLIKMFGHKENNN